MFSGSIYERNSAVFAKHKFIVFTKDTWQILFQVNFKFVLCI